MSLRVLWVVGRSRGGSENLEKTGRQRKKLEETK